MAGNEQVTAPDQHKPGHPRAARLGAAVVALALLGMLFGNHTGRVEDVWLVALAGSFALLLVVDWLLRRNGLR